MSEPAGTPGAEEAALRTQRLYQALLENSHDSIALLSADGRTVFHSPALTRQLGFTAPELVGHHHGELVHPDDLWRAEQAWSAVAAGSAMPGSLRLRLRHRNGGWRVLDISASRFVDDNSTDVFVVLNLRDVTDVVTATEALRENERRLALAFEAASMGVAEFHFATGRVVFSTGFVRLLGYEPGTVPHTWEWFLEHVHAEDRSAVQSAFEIATAGEAIEEIQYRVVQRDGTVRWWSGRARIVAEGGMAPARVIGFVTDITERKILEEQMRHALKLEAIGRLAGGVAHDFNNLLTVITGYAETLAAAIEPSDPKLADVGEIRRAAERAAVLTQQLLAFSRKQVLRPEVVDASEIVRDVAGMIARLIGSGIELTVAVGDEPRRVTADRGQIEQVLLNLAVNARDAMPDGGVLELKTQLVTVTERDAERLYPMRPGRYVMLSVVDTGTGMTPEVRARAFEPFFTTKGPGEGTGIGLASVYGIVKQSGGFVFIDSELGRGSRFDIYLPHTEAPVHAAQETAGAAAPDEATTLLLVEDYRPVRDLARKVLTRHGYRVLTAPSAEEALTLAREFAGRIDVLVTDIVMPGLSGQELVRRLRDVRPGVATIYMSGYTGDTLDGLGLQDQGAEFLQKPFTPASLAQKVREVLARIGRPQSRSAS
jgi:two-component system cell cycle sensor histidine kinase/response regulator CckA